MTVIALAHSALHSHYPARSYATIACGYKRIHALQIQRAPTQSGARISKAIMTPAAGAMCCYHYCSYCFGHCSSPAVCLDSTAVGTYFRLTALICSPYPGNIRSHTASVASGVTSRGAGPVPPVVTMRQQSCLSACGNSNSAEVAERT